MYVCVSGVGGGEPPYISYVRVCAFSSVHCYLNELKRNIFWFLITEILSKRCDLIINF